MGHRRARRRDEAPPEEPPIGPFLSPSGAPTGFLPHPLDSGPPQPEPEERWTLGPRPHETAGPDEAGPQVVVEPVHGGAIRLAGDDLDAPGAADE